MKKSGGVQMIPEFGNWDFVNDLPITQYFDSAREAGLVGRYTDCRLYSASPDFHKLPRPAHRQREKDQARPKRRKSASNADTRARKMKEQNAEELYNRKVKIVNIVAKPVDEDLYKIPPELLHTSKKKRMFRFFSKCLMPSCAA